MQKLELNYPQELTLDTRDIEVRITDLNYAKHLAHDKLITMLHHTRFSWLNDNNIAEDNVEGKAQVIVSLEIAYKSESFAGDILQVETAIGEIGSKNCEIYQRVTNKKTGREVAVVKIILVFFDLKERCAVSAPAAVYKLAKRQVPNG